MNETPEELALLLRIEYGSYEHCNRWYQKGRYDRETTVRKINSRCRVIRNLKRRCRQELQKEDYPEEYYLPDPLPAEELLANLNPEPESDQTSFAATAFPDSKDTGTQLSIFDLFGDCIQE